NPQSRNFSGAELDDDRFKPVVTGRAAVRAQSHSSKRKRHFIENNEHFLRWDFVKLDQSLNRFAAPVHVARRFNENRSLTFCPERTPAFRMLPRQSPLRRKAIDNFETDIMARAAVF